MPSIRDLMTPNPCTVESSATVTEVARLMKERDIGDVLVLDGGELRGIVTDRDIVIRALAEGRDVNNFTVGEVCSGDLATCGPDASVEEAAQLMRQKDIRRLPIVEGGKPVGIVSIGDLAIEKDPDSALADISAAPGNT